MKMMNTMRKLTLGLMAVVLASLFVLPATAVAQDGGEATVEGRGRLHAKGSGDVDIEMGGRIRLRVDGDVSIVDNGGDMRVRIRGASDSTEEERSTNVTLTDFRGFINVAGTDFSVTVDGQVVLNAHGRGEANLVGTGTYKTHHGDVMAWDGLVRLGGPEVQPAE